MALGISGSPLSLTMCAMWLSVLERQQGSHLGQRVVQRQLVHAGPCGPEPAELFDFRTQKFQAYPMPRDSANVRQILVRPGEVWLSESANEHITLIRTR